MMAPAHLGPQCMAVELVGLVLSLGKVQTLALPGDKVLAVWIGRPRHVRWCRVVEPDRLSAEQHGPLVSCRRRQLRTEAGQPGREGQRGRSGGLLAARDTAAGAGVHQKRRHQHQQQQQRQQAQQHARQSQTAAAADPTPGHQSGVGQQQVLVVGKPHCLLTKKWRYFGCLQHDEPTCAVLQ